ncbi:MULTISPECIES: hypothetical protein [unclassified Wolbachia]|uniref:hypothetical protein n=1 Tax=unclassified Wolbachia TaxID=2640676 RepID=UPI0022312B55|nr:hypothetical protein [Wolbachia endosymbiont (group A) of Macropis europaea]MBV2146236.1 hypothetical protein [Wolbachia endosymbiont of Pissodes strobi]
MTINTNKSILKWENTAHITKMSIEGLVALASLAGAITAILIATKVIAGPASLALVASPAGIAVLFIAAVYFAAAAYASYQQMQKNEEIGVNGTNGKDGKDANFATLVKDVVKSGTIVEETVKKDGDNDVQQLFLTLPIADYKELAKNNEPVHILLADGKVVKLAHVAPENNATEYKVQITKVAEKTTVADMKAELGMTTDSKPSKVAVSNEALEALKGKVATNLADVALENAISNAKKV